MYKLWYFKLQLFSRLDEHKCAFCFTSLIRWITSCDYFGFLHNLINYLIIIKDNVIEMVPDWSTMFWLIRESLLEVVFWDEPLFRFPSQNDGNLLLIALMKLITNWRSMDRGDWKLLDCPEYEQHFCCYAHPPRND